MTAGHQLAALGRIDLHFGMHLHSRENAPSERGVITTDVRDPLPLRRLSTRRRGGILDATPGHDEQARQAKDRTGYDSASDFEQLLS